MLVGHVRAQVEVTGGARTKCRREERTGDGAESAECRRRRSRSGAIRWGAAGSRKAHKGEHQRGGEAEKHIAKEVLKKKILLTILLIPLS